MLRLFQCFMLFTGLWRIPPFTRRQLILRRWRKIVASAEIDVLCERGRWISKHEGEKYTGW